MKLHGPQLQAMLVRMRDVLEATRRVLTTNLLDGIFWPKSAVTISMGKSRIQVAVGSRFLWRIRVKGFKEHAFKEDGCPDPETSASAVYIMFEELRAKKAQATLSVPAEWVFLRVADFPDTVRNNVQNAVAFELDRLTPLSTENAYHDFEVLGERDGRLTAVVAVVPSDKIDPYLRAFRTKGINVEKLTTDESCLSSLCRYLGKSRDLICADVNRTGYRCTLVTGGVPVSSFFEDFESEGTGRVQEFAHVVDRLVETSTVQRLPLSVVLISDDQTLSGLEQYLKLPVKNVNNHEIPRLLSKNCEGMSATAAGAVVEALWPVAAPLDFLSRGVHRRSGKPATIGFIIVSLILASFLPSLILPLQREGRRLAEIEWQIAARKGEVRKVEALKKEIMAQTEVIAQVESFKKANPSALALLKDLTVTLPRTAWTTRTRITETTFEIEGYARSASELLPRLEQSQYLKKAEFSSPTVRDARMESERFAIKAETKGSGVRAPVKPKDEKKK